MTTPLEEQDGRIIGARLGTVISPPEKNLCWMRQSVILRSEAAKRAESGRISESEILRGPLRGLLR
jgi:hypothetical protein